MKALILAAGLGTRLLPYTRHTPKPLFTLNQRPVLDLIVDQLHQAGCRAVVINTHHLHEQIEAFIAGRGYPIPVSTRHEPEILGTGGAIRNVADFWQQGPLLVVNADIVADIDLRQIYQFHQGHDAEVTMVMHDHTEFNSVVVDPNNFVVGFDAGQKRGTDFRVLAFTGIHVLGRRVLDFLPPNGPAHIIDAYARMLAAGEQIKAAIVHNHYWRDIGTPASYQAAAFDHMVISAFEVAFGQVPPTQKTHRQNLKGDGSDRRWQRLSTDQGSLLMVDHGIRMQRDGQLEVDAFVDIGRHLHARSVCVPQIYLYDRFSGMVFLQDLGDRHLQEVARRQTPEQCRRLYEKVIDQWLHMAIEGARDFDTGWTHQSTYYDRQLILERECRYFIEAYVNGYLGRSQPYADLAPEFEQLAEHAIEKGLTGFLHRDLQSRNIMIKDNNIFFIDFQGGRLGPIQYDLASLLIDPYVALNSDLQNQLFSYAVRKLTQLMNIDAGLFERGYEACVLTRNLQALGAFGFLSRMKGKRYFEAFIPTAVKTLRCNLSRQRNVLPKLTALVEAIANLNQSARSSISTKQTKK